MHSGRCKYENGGTTAVSRLELCFHEPHESFDFRLKEDVPVQFRMFFRPEPSKEGEADESELGILISDFDSNDSFDCRIECTIVDGKLRRIHKSVCNNYTFERETKECWSVRLPRQALRDEQKYGRVCVDFRLELKPPGSHEKENEEVAADAEPELSPPTTFQLEVPDLRQSVRSNTQLFNGVILALNYFPGATEHRTANCEFVIGHFRSRPFINLRLEWSVRNDLEETNFEHSGTHMFNGCNCRKGCSCGLKRWKFHYIIPPAVFLFSHGEPVVIVLKVSEVLSKPPGIPAHFVWSIAHAGFVNPKILPPPEQYGPIQPPANGNEWKNGVLPPPPPPPDLLANGTGDHASPVPADPLDNVPAKTYYMDVTDLTQEIKWAPLREFEDLRFVLRYFPPKEADVPANFEFVLVQFPNNASVSLALDWGLMRPDGLLAHERKRKHDFFNCACPSRCQCPHKKVNAKYFISCDKLHAQKELHGVFLSLKIRRCSPKKTFPLDIPCLSDVQYLDPPAAFSPQEKKEELPPLVPMEIDEPQPAGAALASPIEDHSKPEVKEGGETVEDGEKPAPQAAEATVPGDVITLTDDEDEAVGCSGGKQDAKLQPIQRAVAETDEPNRTFEHKEAKQNAQLNGHHDSGHSLSHLPPEQMGGRTKSTKMSAVNGTGVKKEDLSFVQPEGTPAFSTADPRIPPSKRSRAAKEEGGMVEEKKPRVIEVVTIEADGEKFKVDKQRLTAESTFFAQAVAANEGAGAFEVDGIDRPSMVALCEWVERGEVANFEQKACDLFIMAKQLGMPAFQAACIEAIKRGQTDENQAALFVFAVQQDDEELLGALSPWNEETTRKVVELLKCPDMKDVLSARSPFMAEMYAAMYPN